MEKTISKPMQRVVDALVEGRTVSPDDQAALSEDERREVAALARTAHLTKLTLARPDPTAEMAAAALARARDAYEQRRTSAPPVGTAPSAPPAEFSPLVLAIRRLLQRFRQER
ncbi:MAG: hypothetical protein H7Z41_08005 [Cytophagales bacterium]|nr:hypothetical protein [Armatimonadota bacterium]